MSSYIEKISKIELVINQLNERIIDLERRKDYIDSQIIQLNDSLSLCKEELKSLRIDYSKMQGKEEPQINTLNSSKEASSNKKYDSTVSKQVYKIIHVNNGITRCPYDNTILIISPKKVAKYKDAQKTDIEQFIPVNLLYCSTCSRTYINNNMRNKLMTLVPLKYLDIVQKTNEESKKITKSSSETKSFLGLHSMPRSLKHKMQSDELLKKSLLIELGYRTNLSKQKRWDIIINHAVPRLGYNKVRQCFEQLISEKGENFDSTRIVSIIEEDLKRLNLNYLNGCDTEEEVLKKMGDIVDPLEVLKWLDENGY